MGFDYRFEITIPDGTMKSFAYQWMIKDLGIEDVICTGAPMKEGGTPQAQHLKLLLERAWPGSKCAVFYNDNLIF